MFYILSLHGTLSPSWFSYLFPSIDLIFQVVFYLIKATVGVSGIDPWRTFTAVQDADSLLPNFAANIRWLNLQFIALYTDLLLLFIFELHKAQISSIVKLHILLHWKQYRRIFISKILHSEHDKFYLHFPSTRYCAIPLQINYRVLDLVTMKGS